MILSKKRGKNRENIACRIQIGVRFYPRRFPRVHANLRANYEELDGRKNIEREREESYKMEEWFSPARGVRRETVLSFSLCISLAAFSALDSSHCNSWLLLSPRVEGNGKSSGCKTHWHTYRSFPFLRFEYHKTWRVAMKAAQTAMQSRTKPVASAARDAACCNSVYVE